MGRNLIFDKNTYQNKPPETIVNSMVQNNDNTDNIDKSKEESTKQDELAEELPESEEDSDQDVK